MTETESLKEKLFRKTRTGWEGIEEERKEKIFTYCKNYMDFLNHSKTEREIVKNAKELAEQKGFKSICEYETLKAGDKVYYNNRDKSMYLAIIGEESIEKGINIIGSHADSPRLDLKPNPLYEDSGFAYFKTHYYGGIKKYQWTTIPLAIHGVIVKPSGEKIEVIIGEEETDPIFTITDLLPHLAADQMERKLKEGIKGEDLNLLIGSIPYKGEKGQEAVKLNIMSILNEKYGITEVDFVSSELELVPAFRARSMGLDNSMVAAYGQDDKVLDELKIYFKPEFINRIDEIIIFNELSKDVLYNVLDKIIREIEKRLEIQHLKLKLTEEAKDYLIERGYDVAYGARPLKRLVTSSIETLLAKKIIAGEVKFGDVVTVDVKEGEIVLK